MKISLCFLLLPLNYFAFTQPSPIIHITPNLATSTSLERLSIDYMARGYFYAYSTPRPTQSSNGWAVSKNKPHKISEQQFPQGELAVTIDTTRIDTFAHKYPGYPLYISNTTGDTVRFSAQDSRLYMKLQAKNKDGKWADIEYLPNSECGNSYHTIELEPQAFWKFIAPKYHGELQTQIRAELNFLDSTGASGRIYSNIIKGSVNTGQFSSKKKYQNDGVMDAYKE